MSITIIKGNKKTQQIASYIEARQFVEVMSSRTTKKVIPNMGTAYTYFDENGRKIAQSWKTKKEQEIHTVINFQ